MSATNRGAERREADYYPTPEYSTLALLHAIGPWISKFAGKQWLEPAIGDGAIVKAIDGWFARQGLQLPKWSGCDIRDIDVNTVPECRGRLWPEQDFLSMRRPFIPFDVIITNPPFSLAKQFIEHSLSICPDAIVIMLLPVSFLGSEDRYDWWNDVVGAPKGFYPLSQRPSFNCQGTDSATYAWMAWNSPEREFIILPPFGSKKKHRALLNLSMYDSAPEVRAARVQALDKAMGADKEAIDCSPKPAQTPATSAATGKTRKRSTSPVETADQAAPSTDTTSGQCPKITSRLDLKELYIDHFPKDKNGPRRAPKFMSEKLIKKLSSCPEQAALVDSIKQFVEVA